MVVRHRNGYEVTTYRVDGEYRDGRHPESVTFTRSLEEDLKRRDFTINALAYDPEEGLVDLFDGIGDLEQGVIRCVGDPDARFSEDALRIMRAVRFSAQLSFRIEEETLAAIRRHVENLGKVSMERIRVEFEKTLLSREPEQVNLYADLGIGRFIVLQKERESRCFTEEAASLYRQIQGEEDSVRILRLAAFFRALPEAEAKAALRDLKYDNKTIRLVSGIIRHKDRKIDADKKQVKLALHDMGEELFDLLTDYREAEEKTFGYEGNGACAQKLREVKQEVQDQEEPFLISHLAVNGNDLLEEGIAQGSGIGDMLNRLLSTVIDDPSKNERETLLLMAKQGSSKNI